MKYRVGGVGMNENFNLALIISPCKKRFGIVIKFAVSKITMNKNWRSKQDSKSIEISAWDYRRWKSEGEGKWRLPCVPCLSINSVSMVNEDDAWKFILKCQR